VWTAYSSSVRANSGKASIIPSSIKFFLENNEAANVTLSSSIAYSFLDKVLSVGPFPEQ